ncbi:Glutaredoxin 3-like isoform X1 [Oopsacas minuta]|uniref:Glutaredoxin 3-like isoform X1 n=1 Tax=Oopsacas minuta TaxID=111878 RepID=A0AAV7K2R9_9METZ|nr:Glutaredoxin 3-like isoform X1 [Oopsacas minuta]
MSHIVQIIQTQGEWDILLSGTERIVCHFWAPWNEYCVHLQSVMQQLSIENSPGIKFIQLEAEKFPEISLDNNISAVPTFILYKGKQEFERVDGAKAAELTKKVQLLAVTDSDINQRCNALILSAPVLLCMKGSGDEPRCKFSKRIVNILNQKDIEYSTYDILQDPEMREGLKEFSNWPTYPQLYHNGELLGGLDIIEALSMSGELDTLPKREKLQDKLKQIISSNNVMLFMKGDPITPRCKFSRATIDILSETGVEYGSFDILEDESVRQGLKEYSDWPTYPQLYVNNEFIGGLDIIRSLRESGELESTLKAK